MPSIKPDCKICRRQGQKLFLKGEKCLSPKCPFIKRPYAPGPKKKRRGFSFSEYAKELREKQKLKNYYGLREKQFKNYITDALSRRGKEDTVSALIKRIESRLDNVVFRMGLAKSRKEARKLVSHKHFLVNNKPVNIPSFETKKDMVISVKPAHKERTVFKNQTLLLKNYQAPGWLKVSPEKLEGKIIAEPNSEEVGSAVDIPSIFEFYSR